MLSRLPRLITVDRSIQTLRTKNKCCTSAQPKIRAPKKQYTINFEQLMGVPVTGGPTNAQPDLARLFMVMIDDPNRFSGRKIWFRVHYSGSSLRYEVGQPKIRTKALTAISPVAFTLSIIITPEFYYLSWVWTRLFGYLVRLMVPSTSSVRWTRFCQNRHLQRHLSSVNSTLHPSKHFAPPCQRQRVLRMPPAGLWDRASVSPKLRTSEKIISRVNRPKAVNTRAYLIGPDELDHDPHIPLIT